MKTGYVKICLLSNSKSMGGKDASMHVKLRPICTQDQCKPVNKSVQKCTKVYKSVQKCAKVYKNIDIFTSAPCLDPTVSTARAALAYSRTRATDLYPFIVIVCKQQQQ